MAGLTEVCAALLLHDLQEWTTTLALSSAERIQKLAGAASKRQDCVVPEVAVAASTSALLPTDEREFPTIETPVKKNRPVLQTLGGANHSTVALEGAAARSPGKDAFTVYDNSNTSAAELQRLTKAAQERMHSSGGSAITSGETTASSISVDREGNLLIKASEAKPKSTSSWFRRRKDKKVRHQHSLIMPEHLAQKLKSRCCGRGLCV